MAREGVPVPGRSVRGSTTGRPVMAALDLLGRRWALRVLWELRSGPVGARLLLERCEGLSSSVLYDRIRELVGTGLIEKDRHGEYQLTGLGRDLGEAIAPLEGWARRWAEDQQTGSERQPSTPGADNPQRRIRGRP